jgi:hypothetical protein
MRVRIVVVGLAATASDLARERRRSGASRTPAHEYSHLRAIGYPLVYKNVSHQLMEGALIARPTQHLVTAVTQ